jgi:2-polyprenyl-3-methyl-5-hydroxy-6-metoxy-1,4-benzoquinol methylase
MNKLNISICPLCQSNDTEFVSSYPGSFLSCKELLQCQNCELIFADKLPSKKELDEYYSTGLYYDKVSDPYNPQVLEFSLKLSRSRQNLINSNINIIDKPRVIDIGAGNASFGIALKECYDEADYDVIEPDKEVRSKYGNWVNKQFSKISELKIGIYDLVIMNQVLEHVSDPIVFLGSVNKLLNPEGYVYIDVPYQDYLFKPSAEPHLLFWNKKSLSVLLEKTGLKTIFSDTAGMPHSQARRFFHKQSFKTKICNPWNYMLKVNQMMNKFGLPIAFDTFRQFQSDRYGDDRQWLRCIAQKIN